MTPSRTRMLRRFIDTVWDQGDEKAVESFLAERYTLHHDPGDPWNGRTLDRAGFVQRLRSLRGGFPDQRFTIHHLLEDGDSVAMFWYWSGTHRGDLPGFPATGDVIHMSGATCYGVDTTDRLTGHWQITDRLGVFEQLARNRAPTR